MLWGAPGRSTSTRRGRLGQGIGLRRRRRRPRLPGGQHRLQLRLQRRLVEVAGDDQRRVVRPVVDRVKSAHVVERDRVDRPLEPVDRLPVRVGVAVQRAIGDHVDDRLGLIAALHDARPPVVVNALPVSHLQPGLGQDVGGHRHRRAERLARRLHRQLRAVASTPQPQVGAQLLQLRRDAQRVARARALVQHLGGDRRQPGASGRIAGAAAAEHERRGHDRRHVTPQANDLEPARQRKAGRARQGDGGQGSDGRRLRHRRRRLDQAVTAGPFTVAAAAGSGVTRRSRCLPATTRANASRTDAVVVCS